MLVTILVCPPLEMLADPPLISILVTFLIMTRKIICFILKQTTSLSLKQPLKVVIRGHTILRRANNRFLSGTRPAQAGGFVVVRSIPRKTTWRRPRETDNQWKSRKWKWRRLLHTVSANYKNRKRRVNRANVMQAMYRYKRRVPRDITKHICSFI